MGEKVQIGKLVVAEVREIHSNSVELNLAEYNLGGFLNVSNIPGLWIRNLKKNIKKGQLIVGKVIQIDHTVEISLKGVSKYDKERKLKEYSLEKKSVKMFHRVCEEYKIKRELAHQEISRLRGAYGSIYDVLEKIRGGEDIALGEKFSEVGTRFKTGVKIYEFRGELELHSNLGNGIDKIKESLLALKGVDATYIGNMSFLLKLKTANPKKGKKSLKEEAEKTISKIKKSGGFGEFKLL